MAGIPEMKYLSKLTPELFTKTKHYVWDFFPSWQEGTRWWNLAVNYVCDIHDSDIVKMQFKNYTGDCTFPNASPDYVYRIVWKTSRQSGAESATFQLIDGDLMLTAGLSRGSDLEIQAKGPGKVTVGQTDALRELFLALLRKELSPV